MTSSTHQSTAAYHFGVRDLIDFGLLLLYV